MSTVPKSKSLCSQISSRLGLFQFFFLAGATLAACGSHKDAGRTRMEARTLNTPQGEIVTMVPWGKPEEINKVIGDNDLTPVLKNGDNIPEKYRHLLNAFGKISLMGCTATHIGKGLVLTAGHCLEAPEKESSKGDCSSITVQWGLREGASPYLISSCVEVLAYEENDDRDYAIFSVDKVPAAVVEVDFRGRESMGTTITLFGHPKQRPLEWSKTCEMKPAAEGGWGASEFSHQCDTEQGNSGATVLDDASLKIVGIHGGGILPWNYGTFVTETPLKKIFDAAPERVAEPITSRL